MDIRTSGTPVLAIEQGTATEKERSEWVRQAQIPIIYQEDDDKGKKKFMVIYRTSAGAAAIESLGGAADLGDAAAKARSFLNEHPGDAGLGNYGQKWKTYNDRESGNLMNVVAVIYGAALTLAISNRPSLILRPVSAPNLIPSLALLAAGILTAVSFYGYVLWVGGDKPYEVTWTTKSNQTKATFRFFVDLVLATLYVHLLFTATQIETGFKQGAEAHRIRVRIPACICCRHTGVCPPPQRILGTKQRTLGSNRCDVHHCPSLVGGVQEYRDAFFRLRADRCVAHCRHPLWRAQPRDPLPSMEESPVRIRTAKATRNRILVKLEPARPPAVQVRTRQPFRACARSSPGRTLPDAALAELASFFGQFQGRAFPLVEALGVRPVNVGAGDAVEGGHSVRGTSASCSPFGVHDGHSGVGLAGGFVG